MKKIIFLLILNSTFLILNSFCSAQNRNIDSLSTLLKSDKEDTSKVNHLTGLSREYINIGLYDTALACGNSALKLAEQFNFKKGIASSYFNIGIAYMKLDKPLEALKNYFYALKIRKSIGDKKGIAYTYNLIGTVYYSQGNFTEALKNHFAALEVRNEIEDKRGISISNNKIGEIYYHQGNYPDALKYYYISLKTYEDIGDKRGLSDSYNNIGIVYQDQGNTKKALEEFLAALKIREDLGDKFGIAASYNNIGSVYFDQHNYPEAIKNFFASLKIRKEIGDKQGIAMSYFNIGNVYLELGNNTEAVKNYSISLKIREEIGNKQGIAHSLKNLGLIYIKLKKLKEAQDYLKKALQLSLEIGDKESIKESYSDLSTMDTIQGNWKAAFQHHNLFIIYKDSIDNEETKKKIIESTMTYEFEKKEAESKADQDKKDAVAVAERKRQRLFLWFVIAVALAVASIAAIIFRSLGITKKQKQVIESQKDLVEMQNEEITIQKLLVEAKNKDISDSVAYAKRIQSSFLTSETYIKRYLPEYFILYKPRDVVSGDFYWMHQQGDYLYFCIADCTGHGIPGAFMSLIGMGVLNEIVYSKQIKDTNKILDELRRIVILSVNPEGSVVEGKDGMDLVLGRLHLKTKELQYSAANNSFYVCRNGELIKHKPDKMPVGKYYDLEEPFTPNMIRLETGDIIYSSTDGFRDQFGGAGGKKFMSKKFEEYLLSISQNSLAEQKEMLEKEFIEWKGNYEQVDDVTVIGIRI